MLEPQSVISCVNIFATQEILNVFFMFGMVKSLRTPTVTAMTLNKLYGQTRCNIQCGFCLLASTSGAQ